LKRARTNERPSAQARSDRLNSIKIGLGDARRPCRRQFLTSLFVWQLTALYLLALRDMGGAPTVGFSNATIGMAGAIKGVHRHDCCQGPPWRETPYCRRKPHPRARHSHLAKPFQQDRVSIGQTWFRGVSCHPNPGWWRRSRNAGGKPPSQQQGTCFQSRCFQDVLVGDAVCNVIWKLLLESSRRQAGGRDWIAGF
jgi:hypothetical protein